MKRLTKEEFIERSIIIYGCLYSYSLVKYSSINKKVLIGCKEHGLFEQTPKRHMNGYSGCPYCSSKKRSKAASKCSRNKTKQTNLERYGVEYPFQSEEIRNKQKATMIQQYGVDNPFKLKKIQNQIKETNLERYGVENPSQNKAIQEKREKTILERFGVKNAFESKEIQEKIKQTNIERYGVEYATQSKKIYNRLRKTNVERYGVEYATQSKYIQDKVKHTCIERYGVANISQKHLSVFTLNKLNSFEYLYNEYINENKTADQIAKELLIGSPKTICNYLRLHNIPIFKIAKFSKISIQWLNSIMEKEGIYIQHAGNDGEHNLPKTRLLVDGYCKENNTVYEFYGDCWHGNLSIYKPKDTCHPFNPDITTIELYNKTMKREKRIRELGYNIVSIWENNFLKCPTL